MAVCIFINNTDKSLDSLDKADKYISHPSKIAPRGIGFWLSTGPVGKF